MLLTKRRKTRRNELLEGLYQTQDMLSDANTRFNTATQPELIEQCVYEINALRARHTFFMRALREEDSSGENQAV